MTQVLEKHTEECFAEDKTHPERFRKFFELIEILSYCELTLASLREFWI